MLKTSEKKSGFASVLTAILIAACGANLVPIQPAKAAETALGTIEMAECLKKFNSSRVSVIDPGPFGSKDGILNSSKAILSEADQSDNAVIWDLSENRQRGFEEITLNYDAPPAGLFLTVCCEVDGRVISARRTPGSDSTRVGSYSKARMPIKNFPELAKFAPSNILVRRVTITHSGTSRGLTIRRATFGDIQLQVRKDTFITPRDLNLDVRTDGIACLSAAGACSGLEALREELQDRLQKLREAIRR